MAFQFLASDQIADLTQAAISSDLVAADRADRMDGVNKQFVAQIRFGNSALDRFAYELQACNSMERLLGGTVPLPQFLTNCTNWLKFRARPETTLFATIANQTGNATSGTPAMAIAAGLSLAVKQEAIVGRNEMLDFAFLSRGSRTGGSVGRILVPRFDGGQQRRLASGEPWVMSGTAWMIASGLAITNHHVINARNPHEAAAGESDFERQAVGAVLQFDYDAAGVVPTPHEVASLLVFDATLDFAIVSLKDAGPAPLRLAPARLNLNATSWQPVNIIQHPLGGPKKIGIRSNIARTADNDVVRYFTDTDTGSSGSPVCDDAWQVVALHRGAEHVTGVNFQGQDTAYVNLGSQIQAVLERVGSQDPAVAHQIAQSQAELNA